MWQSAPSSHSSAGTTTATATSASDSAVKLVSGDRKRERVDEVEEEMRRWEEAVLHNSEQEQRRQEYSAAMHHLATQYWEGEPAQSSSQEKEGGKPRTHRYDDRLQLCLECVRSYYLGVPTSPTTTEATPLFSQPPLITTPWSKAMRRAFFESKQRMATPQEVEHLLWGATLAAATIGTAATSPAPLRHGTEPCPLLASWCGQWEPPSVGNNTKGTETPPHQRWGTAAEWVRGYVRALHTAAHHREVPCSSPPPSLAVLDVGSCYGPFHGLSLPNEVLGPVKLRVTSIDLEPYSPSPVIAADWLTTKFTLPSSSGSGEALLTGKECARVVDDGRAVVIETEGAAEGSPRRLQSIAVGSYDAVFFCLLLSYLPSSTLRYRAVLHAYLALKPGGLLVVLSTRTQGSRRQLWDQQWVKTFAHVGFERVHIQTREKLVVLSFRKQSRSSRLDAWETSATAAEGEDQIQQWLKDRLVSDEALNGLQITADHNAASAAATI